MPHLPQLALRAAHAGAGHGHPARVARGAATDSERHSERRIMIGCLTWRDGLHTTHSAPSGGTLVQVRTSFARMEGGFGMMHGEHSVSVACTVFSFTSYASCSYAFVYHVYSACPCGVRSPTAQVYTLLDCTPRAMRMPVVDHSFVLSLLYLH